MYPAPVLFVDHAAALGGAEISMLLTLQELDRKRFLPHLATVPGRLAAAARLRGIAVHEIPLGKLRGQLRRPWGPAAGLRALVRIILRERIRLVVGNTIRASIYAALAAHLTRRGFVWWVRDIVPAETWARLMCLASRQIVTVSRAAAAAIPSAEKVHVIYNPVRLADFDDCGARAAHLRRSWGVAADALLVGQVARLQEWKGQKEVIAAAERLRDIDQLRIAIIGGNIFGDAPGYERELEQLVASRGLTDRIIFTGHQEDIPATLRAIDVLVHASRDEPFGRVLIEAAAAEVPIVAYASGAAPELIRHRETGLLVPPGDRDALADAIRDVLADRELARRVAANARASARTRFDPAGLTRRSEAVLAHALQG